MPDLALDGADILKKGRLLPGISTEQYAATLCKWFGVSNAKLPTVLPTLANFPVTNFGVYTVYANLIRLLLFQPIAWHSLNGHCPKKVCYRRRTRVHQKFLIR